MSEKDLLQDIRRMRKLFTPEKEATKCIYILKLDESILENEKAMKSLKFPKGKKYPKLSKKFRGCVYVGVTSHTAEERYKIHADKGKKACKVAKLGYLSDYRNFEHCGKRLTQLYGFKQIGWKENKPELLESWLAWRLYKIGYYVWGSHLHEEVDFLGNKPFV